MKEFKSLGIKPAVKKLVGDSIPIDKILGKEIIVEDFKLEPCRIEKFKRQGCDTTLWLQFKLDDKQHIVFTSGRTLIESIKQVGENDFPFTTTIVQKMKRYEFT